MKDINKNETVQRLEQQSPVERVDIEDDEEGDEEESWLLQLIITAAPGGYPTAA